MTKSGKIVGESEIREGGLWPTFLFWLPGPPIPSECSPSNTITLCTNRPRLNLNYFLHILVVAKIKQVLKVCLLPTGKSPCYPCHRKFAIPAAITQLLPGPSLSMTHSHSDKRYHSVLRISTSRILRSLCVLTSFCTPANIATGKFMPRK